MKTYKIHLIRHGRLGPAYAGRYIGRRTDAPLSEEGVRELQEMRRQLWYPEADVIFTSPMLRCIQTAYTLYPGQSYQQLDELAECDFGIFEGKSYAQLKSDSDFLAWAQGGMKAAPQRAAC